MKELLPPSSPAPSRPSSGGLSRSSVHRVAREGLAGSGGALPYLDRLQAAFGAHDLQSVVAHTDAAAAKAAGGLGAAAYARGNHVAFAGPPSLFVAAHEAAHIVQQRSGLVSEGAVGAPGDRLERQADGVAAAVVAGASVEGMLGAPGPAAAAEAVQCYFLGSEVFNRSPSVPAGARISENGKLVLMGKQQLVATEGAIDTANEALEENSMVLMGRGDKVDIGFDLPPDADGMQTIVFDDYYEVRPRMNPETMNPHDPAHALSPAHGDDDEVIAAKHLAYMKRLDDVERDLARLVVDAAGTKVFKTKEAARKADSWASADPMRSELLKLQVFPIFRSFEGHKDREKLVADLEDLQARLHQFVLGEMLQTDAILLPNDCATCVSEMVGDHTRRTRDDSLYAAPEIGSNYYTGLPKPKHAALGWNFHWAGVVMADGSDRATLESAGGLSFGSRDKATWWFNLYGTRVADQTFKKQIYRTHLQRNLAMLRQGDGSAKDLEDIAAIEAELGGLDEKFK